MVEFENYYDFKEISSADVDEAYMAIDDELKSGEVGYYILPENNKVVLDIEAFVLERDFSAIKNIVVVGIGGSSLGTKAIDHLLKFTSKKDSSKLRVRNDKNLIFLENVDPNEIEDKLKDLELLNSFFIIISKSGSTIETTSHFKYIIDRFKLSFDSDLFKEHFAVITDENSPLDYFAKDYSIKSFHIPYGVGGRFSVLSSVGLLPLCIVGYDIAEILKGADELKKSFFAKKEDELVKKARFFAKNMDRYPINVLFSYSSSFKYFNEWYIQLWAESLGKINRDGEHVGLTPVGLIGSIDQHSFLQLIVEGKRDKTVTMIKVESFENDLKIPNITIPHLESTNFINTQTFNTLINAQCDATLQSLKEQGIGTDLIKLDRISERSVGYLIYYFELLTSITGYFLNLNTYDQPGVEIGKKILKKRFSIS